MPNHLHGETEQEYNRTEALATIDRVRELAEVGIWALVAKDYSTVAEALADIHEKSLMAKALLRGDTTD